jgi:hypothetical protein
VGGGQAGVLSTLAFALRQVGREAEAHRALAAAARFISDNILIEWIH